MPEHRPSGDHYRVGQLPHLGMHDQEPASAHEARPARGMRRQAVLAWTVGAAAAGALLTGCGNGQSSTTRLVQAADAQVVTATGHTVAARPGLVLHVGDEVRTGNAGAAILTTGDRRSYLGGQGSYTVRGRSAGTLGRGAFVVDARHGPALTVISGPVTARVDRSAVRLEHGFAARVGVLAGRPVTVSADPATGPQQLAVQPLYQVVVAGRGLSGATALTLTDDDAESRVVPDLVGDDVQLAHTATALDAGREGRAIVRVASADFGATATRRTVSEAALPMAMARAVTGSGNTRAALAAYKTATRFRDQGGSWGVVARLIGTDATATSRAIDALLVGVPSAGTVLAVAPAGGAGTTTGNASGSRSTGSNSRTGNGNGNGGSNPPSSGNNPGSHPTPSPSPSPGPLQQIVDGVVGQLPPLTQPTSSPKSCQVLGLLNC